MSTHLQSDGQQENKAYARHADYYLTYLQKHQPALQSHHQRDALAKLSPDSDNIRLPWDQTVAYRLVDSIQRSAWSFWYFHELCTLLHEGEMLLHRAGDMVSGQLQADPSTPESTRLKAIQGGLLAHLAFFCLRMGRMEDASQLFQSGISILRSLEEEFLLSYALAHYGLMLWVSGKFDAAVSPINEALSLCRSFGDRWHLALYTTFLGMVLFEQSDYDLKCTIFYVRHYRLPRKQGIALCQKAHSL